MLGEHTRLSQEVITSRGERWATALDNDPRRDRGRRRFSKTAVYAITLKPTSGHGSTPLIGTTELDAQSTHHNLRVVMTFDMLFDVLN
jgi:hypothetical protein